MCALTSSYIARVISLGMLEAFVAVANGKLKTTWWAVLSICHVNWIDKEFIVDLSKEKLY